MAHLADGLTLPTPLSVFDPAVAGVVGHARQGVAFLTLGGLLSLMLPLALLA